jgi:curli biogenesis system outer membrane secretion channel CsgG
MRIIISKYSMFFTVILCLSLISLNSCYQSQTKKDQSTTTKTQEVQPEQKQETTPASTQTSQPSSRQLKGPKLRVGIFKFLNKSTYGQGKLGESATDVFITELVKTDKFIVIERSAMDQFEQENKLVSTGVVDASTAVKAGKILGLNAIVYGVISQFAVSEGYQDYAVYKKRTDIADCVVDIRIIDAQTGQILFADTGKGKTVSEKKSFLGMGERGSYDQTLAENALRSSITQLFDNMLQRMSEIPWSGKVAAVDKENVYINGGTETGIKIGDILTVYRPGKEIIDPDTKLSMGYTRTKVGKVQIKSYFGKNGSIAQNISDAKILENDIVTLEE